MNAHMLPLFQWKGHSLIEMEACRSGSLFTETLLTLFRAGLRSRSTPLRDERDLVRGRYSSVTVTAALRACWEIFSTWENLSIARICPRVRDVIAFVLGKMSWIGISDFLCSAMDNLEIDNFFVSCSTHSVLTQRSHRFDFLVFKWRRSFPN